MIPPVLNDTGDCCCQCPPSGPDGWCHCNDDYNGKGDDIENAIACDLIWTERQPNGRKKYFKVVSGSSQQNMPVVLPTASLTKRGVVQLTNDLSDREDLALTPKAVKGIKEQLDRETADRVAKDTDLQNQINEEKTDRANADADLLIKINQEKADRANANNALSNHITSVESKADSALSKANNSVTSVTSDGNATVTVTKADGTSKSFTINNVAHASSADSATNANHATSADNATHATNADTATKATNADHALVADRLASGSDVDTSTLIYKKYNISYQGLAIVKYELANKQQLEGGSSSQYKWTYDYIIDLNCPLNKTFGDRSELIYVSDDVGTLTMYKDRTCVLNNDKSSVTVTMRYKSAYTYTGSNENPPSPGYAQVNYNGVVAIRDVQIKIID